MTKRDKPAMSEEEFEKAIKELAQKEFATGKRDDAAYRKLCDCSDYEQRKDFVWHLYGNLNRTVPFVRSFGRRGILCNHHQ